MAILVKGVILPIGGVASGRVCACSLQPAQQACFHKLVELAGGGSVIKKAYPV